MPRRSAAAIVAEAFRRSPDPQPTAAPPEHLSAEAAKHWLEIVASKPPTHFDAANQILLGALCKAIVTADVAAREMAKYDPADPKQFRMWARWTIVQARQTKMIAALCAKLRLLPRSTPTPTLHSINGGQPPWERRR